jgi:hypothetical protein
MGLLSKNVVVFIDGCAYWLQDTKLCVGGEITGFVVNGCWHISIDTTDKTVGVVDDEGSEPRPYKELVTVDVPNSMSDDNYNDVIVWAAGERNKISGEQK